MVQLLSVSSDGLMKLWTMRSQECEATFDEHNDRVWALALSPDGKEVRWLSDEFPLLVNLRGIYDAPKVR